MKGEEVQGNREEKRGRMRRDEGGGWIKEENEGT